MSLVTDGLGGGFLTETIVVPAASFEGTAAVIRDAFNSRVTTIEPLPTQFPNQDSFAPPVNSQWARLDILFGESLQRTMGNSQRVYRTPGIMQVRVLGPLDKGDKAVLVLADKIAGRFRSVTYNGVTFRTPSLNTPGRTDRWWEVVVSAPFYFELVS